MTFLVPVDLDQPTAGPSTSTPGRPFASPAAGDDDAPDLADLVRRVRGARRIVVICGAGVSTAVAIPDFRSARGLFSGSKGHAIKDLFHVKSLSSPTLLPEHHALLTDLCERSFSAEPTPFHRLLASIDTDGRLLRCYTQNIDGLEERAGLRTGIPPHRKRARKGTKERADDSVAASANASTTMSATASAAESMATTPAPTESDAATPSAGEAGESASMPTNLPIEHPPAPRCIPLHGLLRDMHCSLCATSVPLSDFLPLPPAPIPCPQCDAEANIRSALSERQRRVGTLRASVVLYGEEHPEGELIGTVVERDLKGTGRRGEREGRADMLIVVGTSLAIPGVKRIVKEMAKALSARPPTSVRDGKAPPVRTVYLNAEPPAKPGEWDGVFDVWAQGDIQQFAELVTDESFALPVPKESTPRSTPKRKAPAVPPTPDPTPTKKRARKAAATDSDASDDATPTKKRKTTLPLTPRPTPPRPKDKAEKVAKEGEAEEAEDSENTEDTEKPEKPSKSAKSGRAKKVGKVKADKVKADKAKAKVEKPEKPKPTNPNKKSPAKRPRPPSPSPAAKEPKEETKPCLPKWCGDDRAYVDVPPLPKPHYETMPSTPKRPSTDEDTKSRTPKRHDDDHAYVDVPRLPGLRSEWHRMESPPSPPAEIKPSLAQLLHSHSDFHSHKHTHPHNYTHHINHSHGHSYKHSHNHSHSHSHSHNHFHPHNHSHTTHTHISHSPCALPTALPLPFPPASSAFYGGTFESFLSARPAPHVTGARFSPPPPVGI